ncbi:GH36-type glycosyl hydrolase domain-containing protein [Pullulanibacillus pueri]|nr:cellobiose phosphorylase [Pullulanibacillus pueri]
MKTNDHNIRSGTLNFSFLESGDVYQIKHDNIMINQLLGNPIDGALNNIYLRLYEGDAVKKAVPLLGVKSESYFSVSDDSACWIGEVEKITYKVELRISERAIWFWDITLNGSEAEVDLIYGQDLGLAEEGAVRSNEAYVSQYLDHQVLEDEREGYVICTRQNQPQHGHFPYLQQGSLQKIRSYSTDGFQFFGLYYKTTNQPKALSETMLESRNYQYEFAYSALQTERIYLKGTYQAVFYGLFKADHPSAVTALNFNQEIFDAWKSVRNRKCGQKGKTRKVNLSPKIGEPLVTESMTEQDLQTYFSERQLEEKDHDTLLSFFTKDYEHVVLKEKEQRVERPHGHILISGHNERCPEQTFASTSYMTGIFNSQVVIGNTNMNKMISNIRNPLNIMKTSGQRIYVEIDGTYRLLTMPSAFEIGVNYGRWYYKTTDDLLIITNFIAHNRAELELHFQSMSGKEYHCLVTNQIIMNTNEYETSVVQKVKGNTITFSASEQSDSASVYPDLRYQIELFDAEMDIKDETLLAQNVTPGSASLVVLNIQARSHWKLNIKGTLTAEMPLDHSLDFDEEKKNYRKYLAGIMRHFKLSLKHNHSEEIEKLNAVAWWYTHNMLVHYSSPHGLEQYGGAAWGTRDVCQGPAEYFLATQNYPVVRHIIKKVFSHQDEEQGCWPQWFMFDDYPLQQAESHGDVIVWPLKLIGDYLKATGDFSIVIEKVPYVNRASRDSDDSTIMDHIQKAISAIQREFLHDTYLSAYGDGDWDDTLQPANQKLKKYMASAWTIALTYQTLRTLSEVFMGWDQQIANHFNTILQGIEHDYQNYILKSDVIPGFIYMENQERVEPMLHPDDHTTNIKYRLLPMQRSIISELFTPTQAEYHYCLIKKYLSFPDGVRLMNCPSDYKGGVSTHFKRSEQAANFGREIGLQYVHAHIRFVEAMAKMGKAEDAWRGLAIINPIQIQTEVPNAEVRQSNTYFSSSDGKFDTRYDAQEHFEQLRQGEVAVKGGWRIYSSGPGIYMNQLISNVLGIRMDSEQLVIDPVLPHSLDGLEFQFKILNTPITFCYHLNHKNKDIVINGKQVSKAPVRNKYRQGGFVIEKDNLKELLRSKNNKVDIFI